MAISPLTPSTTSSTSEKPVQRTFNQSTAIQYQKASLNISIMQATEATLGVKDQPLALLLRTAIEKLNEHLAPTLGENAIENAAASGVDYSPEATAQRIVSMSTAFYGAFKQQHPNEAESDILNKFMDTIGGGIDQGFEEAREILDSLNVLQGDIASNIDKTYELVQQGLQAFRDLFIKPETEVEDQDATLDKNN